MARRQAHDRIKRLLSVIPWVVANPGTRLEAIANRFDLEPAQLLDDLSIVYMVGLPPYTPDALVDVEIDEDSCVWIRLADYFARPLQLTPSQGLALLTSSEALRSVPGHSKTSPLESGLEKLSSALGIVDDDVIDVTLGEADEATLKVARKAIEDSVDVTIDYYSYGRDSLSQRRITPWRLMADSGFWYLQAWCHLAEDERLFRVDRIDSIEPHENSAAGDRPVGEAALFSPSESAPRVTIRLEPSSLWVLEAYPTEEIVRNSDGTVDVTLVVVATAWFQRLMLKLGQQVTLLNASGFNAEQLIAEAADKVLSRY